MLAVIAIIVIILIAVFWYVNKCKPYPLYRKLGFTLHYADWCPACQRFKPEWESIKLENPEVVMSENDESKTPHREVETIPAMSYVVENVLTGERSLVYYNGKMTKSDVENFILN